MDTTTNNAAAAATSSGNSTESSSAAAATIQHVTKKSSDELLRKFADGESKRRKRSSIRKNAATSCESPAHNALVEKRSLLPVVSRNKSVLLIQLGIGRSQLRARDIKNKSILVSIQKTWRKTLEGASKVLLEKHYNRHKRLISDVV